MSVKACGRGMPMTDQFESAPIGIRRALREDIPAMAQIVCDWENEVDYMPGGADPAKLAELIDQAFDARQIYVVGAPVSGYMSVDPEAAKIGAIYLRERGRGQGKTMLDLAKQGRDFLFLHTHLPNTAAHRFYHREGFETTAALPPESDGEPGILRMEWRQ